MSGKNQHYIPQAVMDPFRIPGARTPQVRVYRKEKSFPSAIAQVAAEDYFYSRPSTDGSQTLDDILTAHENGPLNGDLRVLAGLPAGPVDAQLAARVIAHLTGRGDHFRGMVRSGAPALAELVEALFGTDEAISQVLGVEGAAPGPRFRAIFAEHVAPEPALAALGLPEQLLMSLMYAVLRETRKRGFRDMTAMASYFATNLRDKADTIARDAQGESLAKTPISEGWSSRLGALTWRIETVDAPRFVLPDFIGLAISKDGAEGTIFAIGGEDLGSVLVPLSPTRMLIGDAGPTAHVLDEFNARAVPHCLAFFISAYASDGLDALRAEIGTLLHVPMREGLAEAAAEFRADLDAPAPDAPWNAGAWHHVAPADFDLTSDFLTPEDFARLSAMLASMASRARLRFDIDHLLEVVMRADYAAALAEVSTRLGGGTPIIPATEGWSAACNIDVDVEGEARVVVVLHPDAAGMLLSENDLLFGAGASIVLAQFARIGTDALLEAVLGGQPLPGGGPDRLLLPYGLPAWKSFYVALEECRFDAQLPAFYRERFILALKALQDGLVAARRAYWLSGQIDDLRASAIMPVAEVLCLAASAAAAVESDDGADMSGFFEVLDAMGLLNWFALFGEDLQSIWLPGSAYPTAEAFVVLARHVERLLWTGGIFAWDDGSPYGRIEVPHWTDMDWLLSQQPAAELTDTAAPAGSPPLNRQ